MLYVKAEDEISEFDGVDVLIFPLKQDELKLLKEDKDMFSSYINLSYEANDVFDGENKDFYQNQYNKLCKNPDNWIFYTLWVVVSLSKRKIVGTVNFLDVPQNNEVDINFEVGNKHQNEGFATLAVELLCSFAKNNGIKKVKANFNNKNIKALKVLEKNNFRLFKEESDIIYLQKEI